MGEELPGKGFQHEAHPGEEKQERQEDSENLGHKRQSHFLDLSEGLDQGDGETNHQSHQQDGPADL